MEELERHKGYIIDNKNLLVIDTSDMSSVKFNFTNMYFYRGNRCTQRQPIRFDADSNKILYWVSQSWSTFPEDLNEASIRLLNNYCDKKILGD